jgi:hypothetical protein
MYGSDPHSELMAGVANTRSAHRAGEGPGPLAEAIVRLDVEINELESAIGHLHTRTSVLCLPAPPQANGSGPGGPPAARGRSSLVTSISGAADRVQAMRLAVGSLLSRMET